MELSSSASGWLERHHLHQCLRRLPHQRPAKFKDSSNVTAGDALTVGPGARKELVKVASTGDDAVNLAAPLKFDHAAIIDVAGPGTDITFSPATRFPHVSSDALQGARQRSIDSGPCHRVAGRRRRSHTRRA